MTKNKTKINRSSARRQTYEPKTLGGHLKELQWRFFSTLLIFLVIASIAYPFFDIISSVITAPLQGGQELVYLTPGGAFGFILKVCVYVGLIGVLPMLIFHLYRFVMPAVGGARLRTVIAYTFASLFLAVTGILFSYYVMLPAALHFLTGFNLNDINPMLTIDSYFSFVMTYLLAGALLFQLPIIVMIINSVTPLKPRKMMAAQGYIILGSFIVAAIITPTPDPLNQTLLASPVILMYQLGIFIVWISNRRRTVVSLDKTNARQVEQVAPKTERVIMPRRAKAENGTPQRSLDGFVAVNHRSSVGKERATDAVSLKARSMRAAPSGRSVDGMVLARQNTRVSEI